MTLIPLARHSATHSSNSRMVRLTFLRAPRSSFLYPRATARRRSAFACATAAVRGMLFANSQARKALVGFGCGRGFAFDRGVLQGEQGWPTLDRELRGRAGGQVAVGNLILREGAFFDR